MSQTEIQVTPFDILAILERHGREVALYCAQPPENFSVKDLIRTIARMYSFAERLNDMTATAKEKPANGAAEQAS